MALIYRRNIDLGLLQRFTYNKASQIAGSEGSSRIYIEGSILARCLCPSTTSLSCCAGRERCYPALHFCLIFNSSTSIASSNTNIPKPTILLCSSWLSLLNTQGCPTERGLRCCDSHEPTVLVSWRGASGCWKVISYRCFVLMKETVHMLKFINLRRRFKKYIALTSLASFP